MTKRKKAVAVPRKPTEAECMAIAEANAVYDGLPARPEIKSGVQDDGYHFHVTHDDEQGGARQVQVAFGTRSTQFVTRAISDLANIVGPDSQEMGAAVSLIDAMAPADEVEAAMAIQFAVSHALSLHVAGKVKQATLLPQFNSYIANMTKLQRTMVAVLDGINDHRTGGAQTVIHKHIYVYEGGQAVVAEQVTTGTRNDAIAGQAYGQSPRGPALLGQNPQGYGVPVPGAQGEEAVSNPRRRRRQRGTKGE